MLLYLAIFVLVFLCFRVRRMGRDIRELKRWIVEEFAPAEVESPKRETRGTYSSDKSTY